MVTKTGQSLVLNTAKDAKEKVTAERQLHGDQGFIDQYYRIGRSFQHQFDDKELKSLRQCVKKKQKRISVDAVCERRTLFA